MNYEALTNHESGIWLYPNGEAIICNYKDVTDSTPKMFGEIPVWYGENYPNAVEEYQQDVELTDYLGDSEIVYWADCKKDDIKRPLRGDVYTFDDRSQLLVPDKWN